MVKLLNQKKYKFLLNSFFIIGSIFTIAIPYGVNKLIYFDNNYNTNFKSLENNNFVPIKNFINPYANNFYPKLSITYKNSFEGTNKFEIARRKISFHNTALNANNFLFKSSNLQFSSNSDKNVIFNPVINDFINPISVLFENNIYKIFPSNNLSSYNYLANCGKKHNKRLVCSDKNHIHNRGCTKLYYFDCEGCIPAIKNEFYQKSYSSNEYDVLMKSSAILNSEFEFGKLLKIDSNDYIKSFDKTFFKISYNFDYLRSIMMGSFNIAYATEFYLNNSWAFSDKLKNFISTAILQNKITVFDGMIPKYFKYTEENYDKEHNIRYWIENVGNFSEEYIIDTIKKLKPLDYGEYINTNNVKISNYFLGNNLYQIFKDDKALQNIVFEINYILGDINNKKKHTLSLYDLIHSKNNKIIYKHDQNIHGNLENYKDLGIDNILIKTLNQNIVYVQSYNSGIYLENNNTLKYFTPVKNSFNKPLFNTNLKISNLFLANEYDELLSKELLVKNKVFGYATENVNEFNFGVFTNFNDYLSPIDNLIISDITNDSNNFLNSDLKKLIKNYEMIPNDKLGIIEIKIEFIDNSIISYKVSGFEKRIVCDIQITNQFLNYSNLNLDKNNIIDSNFVLDNLIKYIDSNNIDNNYLFSVDIKKEEFINLLEKIIISKNNNGDDEIKILITQNNKINEYDFIVKNDLLSNNDSSKEQENNSNLTKKETNNLLMILYIGLPLILVISTIITILFIRKKRIKK